MKNVKIIHHNMPLDTECNKYLRREFHQGSCMMAKYAIAAEKQGKFWEVNSLFFEQKPQSEEEIIKLLKESGFGLDMEQLKKDAANPEIMVQIQEDIKSAVAKNQMGTPAIVIGDKFEMGIPRGGYPVLKKMVKENGGKPKHKFF